MKNRDTSLFRQISVFFTVLLIRFYQLFLRPLITVFLQSAFGFASQCKQSPTCSQYTILQIRNHGTITGLKKGLIRFWNCR